MLIWVEDGFFQCFALFFEAHRLEFIEINPDILKRFSNLIAIPKIIVIFAVVNIIIVRRIGIAQTVIIVEIRFRRTIAIVVIIVIVGCPIIEHREIHHMLRRAEPTIMIQIELVAK